jgi:outer membrane receptor protein involved in Fe transport
MKTSAGLFIAILMLAILSTIATAATDPGTDAGVSGVVRDQHGDVIAGARVEARKLSSGVESAAKTDNTGRYEIRRLSPGEYRIQVSRAGFSVNARTLQLSASQDAAETDFVLVPGVIEDTVTVTTSKGDPRIIAETPHAITVTTASEIETRRPASVSQALAAVPNLTTIGANPLAARLRLRGLTSNRLLVVVDGERLNNVRTDPQSGISPATIDVMQLESAEVLSGSGSSLYGSDAIAGTINLVSKTPVIATDGYYLGLRLDADTSSNGFFRRGTPTLNFSTQHVAVRASGSVFGLDSYHAGGRPISLAEVVGIGNFAALMSNAVDTGVARSFAIWELPADGKVPNGQARGFYSQLDLWFLPVKDQSIKYRQLNNQHKNVGFAFLSPPFDSRLQYNGFRRLDKYSLRYEAQELNKWMPHLSVGVYRQKYSFPDDNLNYSIDEGSSWVTGPDGLPLMTGNISTFTPANFTQGKSSVTSYGADVQATFELFKHGKITTGIGYLRDSSVDSFSRQDLVSAGPAGNISDRASTPDSFYEDRSWSNLIEYEPAKFLRLNASLRIDNWRTRAKVTPGFPISTESVILNASFGQLTATPGAINLQGVSGIRNLMGGVSDLRTNKVSVTGSAGILLRLPRGINPYFRWETSYREPGITERYILRNFGSRTFSLLLAPNTALKPERGNIYEAGVKIERSRWRATANYFRNQLTDFIGNEFSPALFIPPDPQNGLDPVSPFFPFHGVLYVQRANTARARIQGVEASYEASFSLGSGGKGGSITPFGTLGWLKGSNLTPDEQTAALIRDFYNREDTPVPLRGTVEDAPLSGITPFSGSFGARYSDRQGGWIGEYDIRYRARITRADPTDLTAAVGTQYGSFASLRSTLTHSFRLGYTFRRERYHVFLGGGVDNLSNRLYFDPFQTAPAPGRSYLIGLTVEGFDLLRHR